MRIALTALLLLSVCVFADTVAQRITEDEALTVDQRALYLVYSVISPEKLPLEYTANTEPARSGSPALHEAMLLRNQVSHSTLEEMLALVNRPTLSGPVETFVSEGGHFRIHYTLTGADATTEAYAQAIATYMDTSWVVECDQMNYFVPPPDNGVGGDDLYDIYIKFLTGGTLGYCSSGGEYKPPDSTHSSSASHIAMNTNLSLKYQTTTSAHEFQHAIQNAYDYEEPTWFMENCTVWMEDNVFDEYDGWKDFWSEGSVRKPWLSIDTGNPYWYGSAIWPRMMELMFGVDAVREVWENCAATPGPNMFGAIDDMFVAHGSSFEKGFMEYGLWRYFVGPFWNENYDLYDEELDTAPSGPIILPWNNHSSLPASGSQMTYPNETYGIAWIRIDLADYQDGWVQIDFDGRDYFEWNLGAFVFNETTFEFQWYECEGSGATKTVAVPTTGWEYAVFFPAFMTETSFSGNYEYTLSYTTGIEEGESFGASEISVQTNPMTSGSAVNFSVPATGYADLSIVDMAGRRVSTLYSGDAAEGSHSVEFQGGLASGTYFVILRHENSVETQRVSILR